MTGDATRTGTTMTTWPDLLSLLLRGEDLPPEDTRWAMDRVMAGEATPVQVAGFLVAVGGVALALTRVESASSPRRPAGGRGGPATSGNSGKKRSSFMDRQSERWDRRRDSED